MTPQNFFQFDLNTRKMNCQGEWNLASLAAIEEALKKTTFPQSGALAIDGKGVTKLDSAGAWLLNEFFKRKKKLTTHFENFSSAQQKLLAIIAEKTKEPLTLPPVQLVNFFGRVGKRVYLEWVQFRDYLAFVGQLTMAALAILRHPSQIRWKSWSGIIQSSGYKALTIIALLSLMIGVVITYQMGLQLRNYGANVYIVDLLGLAILREFAPLLTAIMMAGRTGSSFTAQIGSMKINQEVDALNTMGVSPAGLLLLPRLAGLLIALPLLTIWADIFGVIGGMLMANNMLHVGSYSFLHRFQSVIPVRSLILGLSKAPIFALIIASIGCFEGMKVSRGADSVGRHTTRSVVLAIFFIIVADAALSVLFSKFKL